MKLWRQVGTGFPKNLNKTSVQNIRRPGSLLERYNQILGKMAKTRPAASIGDDFQTLQDALEERYHG